MMNTFQEGLFSVVKKYNNVVFLHSDDFLGCENFLKLFGARSFNLGGGEQNLVSIAAGFLVRKKLPLLIISSATALKAYAQIRDGVCIPHLNIKILVVGGENFDDVEAVRLLPNIKVLTPSGDVEILETVSEMMDEYGPIYLRLVQ